MHKKGCIKYDISKNHDDNEVYRKEATFPELRGIRQQKNG